MEENFVMKVQKEESVSQTSDDFNDPDSESETDSNILAGDKMISMNLLKNLKLFKIKKDFMHNKEGLLKHQFINIMLHHLPEIKDQVSLVYSLNDLFAEIDVNDDKHLEWDEFSNYIIEMGLARKEQGFVQVIKNYNPSEWKDPVKHDNDIEFIKYFPETKHLLVTERDNKKFKVYNMKNGRFEREVKGHTGAVISAISIKEKSVIATSSNDLSIILWEDSTYNIIQKINSPIIPISLTFYNGLLYAGGPEGMIYYWNLQDIHQKLPQYKVFPRLSDFCHDKGTAVTAIIPITSMDLIVTADLAGQILLWSLPSLEPNRKMKKLNKGIYSLDWSSEVECLFSAGLDRAAYVWNPYVTKHIYKLSGHIHSLVGVKCVPDCHQLVTADISGMFKVWDIRTFNCTQSFNAPVAELNAFCVSFPEKKIIAGSKKLLIYTYEEPKDQNKVDEGVPLTCIYNSLYNTFITAHPSCVKIWDANDGQLVKVLRHLTPDDITTIQLDNKKRKLFLGDAKGRVLTFKVKNGAKIKKFKRHSGEVTGLKFLPEFKYLVSCSWDKRVHVHDDSEGGEKGNIRFDQIRHKDIVNSIDTFSDGKYLASCSDDGSVLITNLLTLRQETELKPHEAEVKAIKFLPPNNCLVSTDLSGFVYFWSVSPSKLKNTLLLKFQNKIKKDTGGVDNCPIRALEWDSSNRTLYSGDDLGNINVWNISSLAQKLKLFGTKKDESSSEIDPGLFVLTLLSSSVDPQFKINNEDVKKTSEWKAHEEGIINLHLVEGIKIIVSCAFDYHVYMWNFSGDRLGSLVVMGDPRWKVKIDTQGRIESARKEALELLDESLVKSYKETILDLGGGKTGDLSSSEKTELSDSEEEKKIDKKEAEKKIDFKRAGNSFPSINASRINPETVIGRGRGKILGRSPDNRRFESQNQSLLGKRNLSNAGGRIIVSRRF